MNSSITIAIPTYNRNEKLVANLQRLLPQLSTQKVVIVDNLSDILVRDTLQSLIATFSHIDIKVYNNKTNVGIAANFLRCFEYCETEWMWLLSDDDPVCENAIEIIERDTHKYCDYHFFNYMSSMVERDVKYAEVFPEGFPNSTPAQIANNLNYRKESFTTTGVKELIRDFDSFVNFIFVSSGVYNIPKLLPHLRIGYMYAYSLAPHMALVMASIGDSGKVFFSNQKLVNFEPPNSNDTWSRLTFSQVITLLMEVPMNLDNESFDILFSKITHWFMTDDQLFYELTITYQQSNRVKQWIFIQLIARTIFKKRNFKQKLRLVYRIIKLFFPSHFRSYNKIPEIVKEPLVRL